MGESLDKTRNFDLRSSLPENLKAKTVASQEEAGK